MTDGKLIEPYLAHNIREELDAATIVGGEHCQVGLLAFLVDDECCATSIRRHLSDQRTVH